MKKSFIRIFTIIIVIASTLPYFNATSAFAAYNKSAAKTYLQSHSSSAFVTMALAALGETQISIDYLKNVSGNSAIDYTKPILAITALGADPRTFGSNDLVAKLKSFHQQNQIGDTATVNDDIFGILALLSAGETPNDGAVIDAKNFVLQNQNPNGGWGFAVSGGADSNITAAGIVALKSAGVASTDEKIIKALDYLKTAQNTDGGFTYDPKSSWGTQSDSSSTAWVLWALNSLGINESSWSKEGHSPSEYLASTQVQAGYFEYQPGSGENSLSADNTAWATIALEGKTLPIKTIAPLQKQFPFRIEGANETVCEGKTEGPTALDIVKNASTLCGLTYHIKDTSFGPYLDKINNDEASGTQGWLYWVNFSAPSVGAADYELKDADEVLWAFGNFDVKPSKLSLSQNEINTGQSVAAEVQYLDGDQWKNLEAATVLVGASSFTTDTNGKANISGSDGYYKVFASKLGFIRSNKVLLKIGNPSSSSVSLSVNVSAGQVGGTSTPPSTISFTIEPSSLDFGTLNPGQSLSKTLKLKNTGSTNLQFESQVSSGQLFKDNLKLDGKLWQQFNKLVASQNTGDVEASLFIPTGTVAGQQTGNLIFWASPY